MDTRPDAERNCRTNCWPWPRMPRGTFLSLLAIASFVYLLGVLDAAAQATVLVEEQIIETYPFGDPDPIPTLYQDAGMYPYFRFDGFSLESSEQPWTVVTLENPYIEVTVLPEVGGKVWGAIEKSTGHEFIYKNDVLKFGDISIRGPWTSGGIEFNFGVYGHTPTVSTPVDYVTRANEDGSVSVIVGATDWTSRTKWRVRLTVPPDKAYLEIENLWFNPTPLNGLQYHWLNAAAEARGDLQFFFPGTHYIGHGGDAHQWPIDEEGRDLSFYRNNDFGGSKSYHVLGTYTDYYGGYWHDLDFGFGHWAPYSDAPGKKVWIWSQARSGAIWEDLLTDKDGQYVEIQAGWKFNQTPGLTDTPFKQAYFPPFAAERWTETYFPLKEIGGMVDASRSGVLNVAREGNTLEIAVQALEQIADSLTVEVDGRRVFTEPLALEPMEVARRTVSLSGEGEVIVALDRNNLRFTSDEQANVLERPLQSTVEPGSSPVSESFRQAENLHTARQYEQALEAYHDVLEKEPAHAGALGRLAELYYRRAEYQKSLQYSSKALEIDTYDPYANYMFGVARWQMGDFVNAKEALGWAARSPYYRSGAYAQLAALYLAERNYEEAEEYARRALDFNRYNLTANEVLAVSHRKRDQREQAQEVLSEILKLDPLSHFARFEQYLWEPSEETLAAFKSMIRSELPDESYLELAVQYANAGLVSEAVRVLEEAPADPVVYYWLAYLNRDSSVEASRDYLEQALSMSPRGAFPFRQETLPVLEWAMAQDDSWKTKYYLGTLFWSKGRKQEAADLYTESADQPDFGPFYLARAFLIKELGGQPDELARDLQKATEIETSEWRAWRALIQHHVAQGDYESALRASRTAHETFPDNYYIALEHTTALLRNGEFAESARVLEDIRVLPSEGATQGHVLFEQAHLGLAVGAMQRGDYATAIDHVRRSKEWPEHLGVGRPDDPDERLQDFMEAFAYRQQGQEDEACTRLQAVADFTEKHPGRGDTAGRYIGAVALRLLGRQAEAQGLLESWKNAAGSDDLTVQWALASFSGDESRTSELARALATGTPASSRFGLLTVFMDAGANLRQAGTSWCGRN